MSFLIERINEESNYTKIINLLKERFEDGEIFSLQILKDKYMQEYFVSELEARNIVKAEYNRVITNLAMYRKIGRLPNGSYVINMKKNDLTNQENEVGRF